MKNFEIRDRLQALVREERRITREILDLLVAAMEGRAWLEFGYSSLFDWLTRGFSYSPAAAMRRIEAARLLRVIPEAAQVLGVAAMAQVQSELRKYFLISFQMRRIARSWLLRWSFSSRKRIRFDKPQLPQRNQRVRSSAHG